MNDSLRQYSPFAKILHWWIAGLIILQYVLVNLAEAAEDADSGLRALALMANHKSVGITILGLAVLRLAWRIHAPPPPALAMPRWQARAAAVNHWAFYGLLFFLPLSGWLMSSAAASPVSWFNLVPLPDVVGPSPELEEVFEEIHEALAPLLAALALLHVAAALKHAFVDRNGALRRISSAASLALFVLVLIAGLALLTKA